MKKRKVVKQNLYKKASCIRSIDILDIIYIYFKKTFDKANGKNILTFIAFDELPVGMVKKVREKKYVWTCPGSI